MDIGKPIEYKQTYVSEMTYEMCKLIQKISAPLLAFRARQIENRIPFIRAI